MEISTAIIESLHKQCVKPVEIMERNNVESSINSSVSQHHALTTRQSMEDVSIFRQAL